MRTDFTPIRFMDPQADLRAAQDLVETVEVLKDSFKSLGIIIKQEIGDNIQDADRFTKAYGKALATDLTKSFNNLGKKSEDLLKNQEALNKGQAKEKDILKQIAQNELKRKSISIDLKNALKSGAITQETYLKLVSESVQKHKEQNEELVKQAAHAAKTEAAMGNLGNIVKGLNKIPILGNLINSEKVLEKMQETAAKTKSIFAVMGTGIFEIGKSITKGLTDPLTVAIFLLNQALKANKQTVELGKVLGANSDQYRENLVKASRATTNINVTTASLTDAFHELVQATGLAYEYNLDQLETQIKLTKQVGLQADEAAQVQRLGVLTGKSSEETYKSFVKGLAATRNQLRVGINFKAALAESLKVSGQLAANLGYNPERIAKAVVQAKSFGMTLEQVAKSGEALLNWESSIESELKAELITGKQINLERARAAALVGDQAALAEELASNIGTSADFTKMNVIQQKSLAEAVGMTSDELAETLRRREEAIASGKSLAQINEEEAQKALERQSIQDKFNNAMLRLQDIVGNLVAGPLGQLIDAFATVASSATAIKIAMGALVGMSITRLVTGLAAMVIPLVTGAAASTTMMSALTLGVGLFAILGSIAAISSAMNSAKEEMAQKPATEFATGGIVTSRIDNATVGEAGPEAIIPLNSPKAAGMLGGDLSPLVAAINEVRNAVNALASKPAPAVALNVSGQKLGEIVGRQSETGTNQYQNAYRLA